MTNELAEWSVGDPLMLYFTAAFFCIFWGVMALGVMTIRSDVEWLIKVFAMPPVFIMATAIGYITLTMLSDFLGFYVWPLPLF